MSKDWQGGYYPEAKEEKEMQVNVKLNARVQSALIGWALIVFALYLSSFFHAEKSGDVTLITVLVIILAIVCLFGGIAALAAAIIAHLVTVFDKDT